VTQEYRSTRVESDRAVSNRSAGNASSDGCSIAKSAPTVDARPSMWRVWPAASAAASRSLSSAILRTRDTGPGGCGETNHRRLRPRPPHARRPAPGFSTKTESRDVPETAATAGTRPARDRTRRVAPPTSGCHNGSGDTAPHRCSRTCTRDPPETVHEFGQCRLTFLQAAIARLQYISSTARPVT
jgi:hypothetical protein